MSAPAATGPISVVPKVPYAPVRESFGRISPFYVLGGVLAGYGVLEEDTAALVLGIAAVGAGVALQRFSDEVTAYGGL